MDRAVGRRSPTDNNAPVVTAPPRTSDRYQKVLSKYFAEGSWELGNPKVLESDQGMLLVKEYHNLPDGRVELIPCTMIFFPKQRTENDSATKPAILMQAPGGAILEFDEPFDLKRAKIGRLVGGQLKGQITIASSQQAAGTPNELRIVTRDVTLADDRCWTANPVDFRLGPNFGSGRDMEITLAKEEGDGRKKRTTGIGELRTFQLTRDVKMHIQMGGKGLLPGDNGPRPPADPTKLEPPVEVTCAGAFQFDLARNVATFNDRVDVVR